MPILMTAIKPSGEVDEVSQRRQIRYCLDQGAVAIGHFGFASEFHKLCDYQRTQLIEMIVDEVDGRVPTFLAVSSEGTHQAVNYAKEIKKRGGDIIMAMPPLMGHLSQDYVYEFYQAVSDATDLPIIIQDAKKSAPYITAELTVKMYDEIENIHYIKAEGNDFLTKTKRIIKLSEGRIPVIGGNGGQHMIHMMRHGVTSFMTGTEALWIHHAMVDAFLRGDEVLSAKIYYEQILPYWGIYDKFPEQLCKRMLHHHGVLDHADVLQPLVHEPIDEVMSEEYDWVLKRIGYLQHKLEVSEPRAAVSQG